MSNSTTNLVSAATIRTAFRDGTLNVADVLDAKGNPVPPLCIFGADGSGSKVRGRLHPAFVAHYVANVKGADYREKAVSSSERLVEVPMFSAKTGRPVKSLNKPVSEVRAAAGISGNKGRISKEALHRAAVAFGSGEPKPAAAKATKGKATAKAAKA